MYRRKHLNKSQVSVNSVLYWTVGGLLVLTVLSIWLLGGLHAKYVVSGSSPDSAKVTDFGLTVELFEHEAELIEDANEAVARDGVDKLTEETTAENNYNVVMPGVDIPKDPTIKITGDAKVACEMYVKVIEKNLPETVTYEMADGWELDKKQTLLTGEIAYTYKYKDLLTAPFDAEYPILKDNKLIVSDRYVGNGKEFSLLFDAWVKQANPKETVGE